MRVPCQSPGCTNTILPATAAANNGLCMPCVQRIARAEYAEYVRLNKRTVDLYEGVEDPVERLRIFLTPRVRDDLIEYTPAPFRLEDVAPILSAGEAARLETIACQAMESSATDLAEKVAGMLATFTSFPLPLVQETWLAHNRLYPPVVFRSGGPEVRDKLLRALSAGALEARWALIALAWIGDEAVQQAFKRWTRNPPPWCSDVNTKPSTFTLHAGWELVQDQRRELTFGECLGIDLVTTNGEADSSFRLYQPTMGECRWCGGSLILLLDLDLTDPRFQFLGLPGKRWPVLSCQGCRYFGTIHGKIGDEGTPRVHPRSPRPQYLPATPVGGLEDVGDAWTHAGVRLSPRPRWQSAEWLFDMDLSHIGGVPGWLQWPE